MQKASEPGAPIFGSAEEADRFAGGLGTELIGRRIVHLESTPSTNDVARELAGSGEPEGTVVVAEVQTAGRGRDGARWHSPARSGLLLSYLLRPRLEGDLAGWLTGTAALGAAAAVRRSYGLVAGIDWPNDIVFDGRKLGGVLAESEVSRGVVELAVVGAGLNVNLAPDDLPADIRGRASSVSAEAGAAVNRRGLLAALLGEIDRRWAMLRDGRTSDLAAEFTSLLANVGLAVERPGSEAGTAEGVDERCRLIVRTDAGRKIAVTT